MDFIEGEVLYINKPLYWTSFKVVDVVRAKICERLKIKKLKVGHAGTLDPLATGVMIVCTGKKQKNLNVFRRKQKNIWPLFDWGRQRRRSIWKLRSMQRTLFITLPKKW